MKYDILLEKVCNDFGVEGDIEMYRFAFYNNQVRAYTEITMNEHDFMQIAKVLTGESKKYEFGKSSINFKGYEFRDVCRVAHHQNAAGQVSLEVAIKSDNPEEFGECDTLVFMKTPTELEQAVLDRIAKNIQNFYLEPVCSKISLIYEGEESW